ncbi:hypothetical protein H0H93_012328, partial [Arthromyces matolae]
RDIGELEPRMFKKAEALLGAAKDTVVQKLHLNQGNTVAPTTDGVSSSSDSSVTSRDLDSRAFETLKANYDLHREQQKKESAAMYQAKAQVHSQFAPGGTSTSNSDGQAYRRDLAELEPRMFKKAEALLGAAKDTIKQKLHINQGNKGAPTDEVFSSTDGISRRDLNDDEYLVTRDFDFDDELYARDFEIDELD